MNKEKYKQMNQLDRIEFLLLKKELIITDSYAFSAFWLFTKMIFIILLFGILEHGFYGTIYIFDTVPSITFVLIIYVLIMFSLDILSILKNSSTNKWINNHFQLNKNRLKGGKTRWQNCMKRH